MTFKIVDSGHSKLGAIKSTLPETFNGFEIEAITQSAFVLDPVKVRSLNKPVVGQFP